ncbi:hypothetical protein MAHJHV58_32060 [Mycobacterium avium subsp. hominissuis]|uniref:Lipoprotein n=1 Tax=Mycobacterium avium subsp. hominissuis TaxID=439334 RepID=A0AAI8SS84_MYCAV|nr:hypothetical protein JPH1_47980 [Mycobacterium avium subsp. hominissuis]
MLRKFGGVAACVVFVVISIAGCSSGAHQGGASSTPSSPPAGWPAALTDFTFVWTAEPGIDVTAGPAVPVRAYTESYLLASIMGDTRYLYPGFQQSVDPNQSINHPIGTQSLWPKTNAPQQQWIGSVQVHILSVTTAGRDVTVVACEYTFGSAQPARHGYEPNIGKPPPYSGIDPLRITMETPAKPGPESPQRGPAPTPSVDVFNGWRITSHQGGYFAQSGVGDEWPNASEDRDTCLAKAPPHPDLQRGGEYPRTDFPTLPPSPGWPAPSAAS